MYDMLNVVLPHGKKNIKYNNTILAFFDFDFF